MTRDHTEIGRIQGKQFAALLPRGGTILHIQGPAISLAAVQRTVGMESAKPGTVKIKSLRSPWTERGAYEAVAGWLRLATSKAESIDLVGCQYDGIAIGARKAFQERTSAAERERWLSLPFTGVDGLPLEGQAWVDQGAMTATVISGATTGVAIQMVVKALASGTQPPERTLIELSSYPSLDLPSVIGARREPKY